MRLSIFCSFTLSHCFFHPPMWEQKFPYPGNKGCCKLFSSKIPDGAVSLKGDRTSLQGNWRWVLLPSFSSESALTGAFCFLSSVSREPNTRGTLLLFPAIFWEWEPSGPRGACLQRKGRPCESEQWPPHSPHESQVKWYSGNWHATSSATFKPVYFQRITSD